MQDTINNQVYNFLNWKHLGQLKFHLITKTYTELTYVLKYFLFKYFLLVNILPATVLHSTEKGVVVLRTYMKVKWQWTRQRRRNFNENCFFGFPPHLGHHRAVSKKSGYMYMYNWFILLKLTQHCKATILQ